MGPHLGARSPSPKTDSRAPRQHQAPSPHPARTDPHAPRQHQALGPALGTPPQAASPARLGPLC